MNSTYQGILFVVLSQIAFAFMDSSIKGLSADISVASIILFRNLFTLIVMLPLFIRTGEVKNNSFTIGANWDDLDLHITCPSPPL